MKKSVKDIALIGLGTYAVLSMAYIVMVLSGVTDEGVKALTTLYSKQLLFVLIYSLVLGASFFVFNLKVTPITARLIHIAVTYAASVAIMLLLISSESNAAQKLVYIVITTVVFAAVYGVACLLAMLIKKYKYPLKRLL